MHPGFWEIATRASDLAFSLRIKTNGHGWTADAVRRLYEEVRPFRVEVSLHGARPETHDQQTRVKGSFDRLMTVLPLMVSQGLRVKLNCSLTTWNAGEIKEMTALAEDLGLLLILNTTVSPRDNGDLTPLMIAATPAQMEEVRAFAAFREGRVAVESEPDEIPAELASRKNCGAGSSSLTIDPFGNVYPCVQWRRPVGNILQKSLSEIWMGNRALEEVRDLAVAAKIVRDSLPAIPEGGFCPGLAEVSTGHAASPYALPSIPVHHMNRAETISRRTNGPQDPANPR
jgi:MoaA/NifB/PqqE/SkfB family radical SAM enzyme